MNRGKVTFADQGICCAGKEKKQLFDFVKSHKDVFAVPNSYLTFQLCFNVCFKHVLGHALKGREAVDRASHVTGKKGLLSETGSSAGPESSLSLLCKST